MSDFYRNFRVNIDILDGVSAAHLSSVLVNLEEVTNLPSTGGTADVPQAVFPVFADPNLLLATSSSNPLRAGFEARLAAVTTPFTYIGGDATAGYPANTSDAFIAYFDSLPTSKRTGAIMPNIEYPWLEVLTHGDNEPIPSEWLPGGANYATIQYEYDTLLGSTGNTYGSDIDITFLRNIAANCWLRSTYHALNNGCTAIMHYASTSIAFGSYFSVPNGALRYTAPVVGNDNWFKGNPSWHPTLEDQFADRVSQGKLVWLRLAQRFAIDGAACYCWTPNNGKAISRMSHWLNSAERRDIYGNILSPTFEINDLNKAVRITSRRMWGEYRNAIQTLVDRGEIDAPGYPEDPNLIAAVLFPGGINANLDLRTVRQAMHGMLAKGATITAQNEVAGLFDPADENWPIAGPPDQIWLWHASRYYFRQLPSNTTNPSHPANIENPDLILQSRMMRWSHEVDFFKRPWPNTPDDFPWGATADAPCHAYYAANSMEDAYWNTPGAKWWTVSGGSQLPYPCVLDTDSPLSQYLDWSQDIEREDVLEAICAAGDEHMVSCCEAIRACLTELGV